MDALRKAEDMKSKANKSFASKDYSAAVAGYSEAVAFLTKDRVGRTEEGSALQAILLANRAAAFLQLKSFTEALQDCESSLELDPSKDKALFRRAQAKEGLGEITEAFKDIKKLLQRDGSNKSAISMARRLKDALSKSEEVTLTPLQHALNTLKTSEDVEEQQRLLKGVIGHCLDNGSAAREAMRSGALPTVWTLASSQSSDSETKTLALKVLMAMSGHEAPAAVIESTIVTEAAVEFLTALLGDCGESTCIAIVGIVSNLLLRTPRSEQQGFTEQDQARWLKLGPTLLGTALQGHSLRVRSAVMDTLVQWVSEKRPSTIDKRQWVSHTQARAAAVCRSPVALRVFELLDSDPERDNVTDSERVEGEETVRFAHDTERSKALAAFGRIAAAVKDEELLRSLLSPIVDGVKAAGTDLRTMRRLVALTSALFLSDGESDTRHGAWLLGHTDGVAACLRLCLADGDPLGRALAAETVCYAASQEESRAMLTPIVDSGALERLLDGTEDLRARSAAASTMAKLGITAKALRSDGADTSRLLNTAMALLKAADEDEDGASHRQKLDEQEMRSTVERAVEVLAALVTKSSIKDELAMGSGRCVNALPRLCSVAINGKGASAYGIAHIFVALSITNKEVQRRQLAEREMDITPEQLEELQRITKQKAAEDEDDDSPQRVALRVRKMVQHDAVRALVRLNDGASVSTQHQIALALRQMATETMVRGVMIQQGALKVCIDVSASATKAAEDAAGQGSRRPNNDTSMKAVREAAWCIGKLLITTNPSILTSSQRMGSILPLLTLCKDHKADDLAHFEALMGLTNLASFSMDTKHRIAAESGIRTLEYLQFSEHELVRRAATECLTNMMPAEAMVEHLQKTDKLRLWCALAEDFETDLPTARAASGTIAMFCGEAIHDEACLTAILNPPSGGDAATASKDEDRTVSVSGGNLRFIDTLASLLNSQSPELTHRAAVGLQSLLQAPDAQNFTKGWGLRKMLRQATVGSKKSAKSNPEAWAPALGALTAASEALSSIQAAEHTSE